MKRKLGRLETQLFAYVQLRRLRTLRGGELVGPLRITAKQERELLSRLGRGGLIAQVRPGLYLVPQRLPLGGSWTPDELLALQTLMADRGARYQVCGPNAFNRYGFDEQVPARLTVYNNRISGQRRIGAVRLTLIKVAAARLGDVELVRGAGGVRVPFASRARTLVDGVYDWARFNSLPRAYAWIRADLAARRVDAAELVRVTLRYGDVGTIRRVGALLEREAVQARLLGRLERALRPSTGLIAWSPTQPRRGTLDRRWGVVWNEPD
ncbi:MAG: type IV toxin-antitoxin system AbiEi family antitoxin [bacterium]